MPRAVFDSTKCDRHIARTKERMAERGLDALFVSDSANMNYLTGYDGWSFCIHQGVVVTRDRGEPVWVGHDMDASDARATTTLNEESIRPCSDDHVQSPHDLHPMDFVAAVLEDLGVDNAHVGLEADVYYFTTKSYTRLQKDLVEASFRDTTLLVNHVRIRKSDAELNYMREAVHISENAMRAGLNVIEADVPECEAAGAIYSVLIEGTDDYGGNCPSIVPLMPSDDHTGMPHFTWTDHKFEGGDLVIVELSDCRHRYHSSLARATFVGNPPEELSWRADIVIKGMEAALGVVAPGVTYEAVEKVWRNTITQYGIEKKDRIGYSMGLGYPSDWDERTASFHPDDETVPEEDMTSHTISGPWFDNFGVELSETLVVTSDRAGPLADLPHRLFTT